jgi:hypothetical protein
VANAIDLFTVVTHELGHALGFAHPGDSGLQGIEVMAATLGEGVRRVPQLADGTKLNDVLDVILATFDPASPPIGPIAFSSVTPLHLPNVVTVGETPTFTPDLQLEGLKLTFSELAHTTSWAGEVLVESQLGILMPGQLDIVIVDMTSVRFRLNLRLRRSGTGWLVGDVAVQDRSFSSSAPVKKSGSQLNEPGLTTWTLRMEPSRFPRPPTTLSSTTTIGDVQLRSGLRGLDQRHVILVEAADVTDDVDFDAVSGTLQLAPGDNTSILNLESLEATDLGWPRFLIIQITDLKLEFNDFRVNDSDSHLRMDAAFRGLELSNAVTNQLVKAFLTIEGAANGMIFDMDRLAAGSHCKRGCGFSRFPVSHSGISGLIEASAGQEIAAGFILKVGVDGGTAHKRNEIGAGGLSRGEGRPSGWRKNARRTAKDGTPPAEVGGYRFGFNFAFRTGAPSGIRLCGRPHRPRPGIRSRDQQPSRGCPVQFHNRRPAGSAAVYGHRGDRSGHPGRLVAARRNHADGSRTQSEGWRRVPHPHRGRPGF